MISRTTLHGLRALIELATDPERRFAGASSLAPRIGAPPNYLGKLLQALARAGLVESRKGLGGGFRLAREPESIFLLDVVEAIEPSGRWKECFLGLPTCSDDAPCALHDHWKKVRDEYHGLLSRVTIAEVVERQGTLEPPPKRTKKTKKKTKR
jgi:Rrf2 family protein